MAKSNRLGMKTFDQALFDLYEDGLISYDEALRNADSKNEIRLRIKLESKRDFQEQEEGRRSLTMLEDGESRVF
jgi:twitching motility protein PilU